MGKKFKKLVNKGLGVATQAVTGGLVKYDGKLQKGNMLSGDVSKMLGGPLDLVNNVSKGIEQISGARAQRKALEAQIDSQNADARRQAAISDALANEAANRETAEVSFGRRRKSNRVSNSAGLGGVGQSEQTGVQS